MKNTIQIEIGTMKARYESDGAEERRMQNAMDILKKAVEEMRKEVGEDNAPQMGEAYGYVRVGYKSEGMI